MRIMNKTIREIIDATDRLRPNAIDDNEKIAWLKGFEQRIYNEIYRTHTDNGELAEVSTLTEASELSVPSPYDEMYSYYLMAMYDFNHAEYDRYNNDIDMLGALYEDFERYYNNTHTSAGVKTLTV